MSPQSFWGSSSESFRPWAKKLNAFTIARRDGYRQALDRAELNRTELDGQILLSWGWQDIFPANQNLYDMSCCF